MEAFSCPLALRSSAATDVFLPFGAAEQRRHRHVPVLWRCGAARSPTLSCPLALRSSAATDILAVATRVWGVRANVMCELLLSYAAHRESGALELEPKIQMFDSFVWSNAADFSCTLALATEGPRCPGQELLVSAPIHHVLTRFKRVQRISQDFGAVEHTESLQTGNRATAAKQRWRCPSFRPHRNWKKISQAEAHIFLAPQKKCK